MENHSNPVIRSTEHFKWLYDDIYKCPLCCSWFKSEKTPLKCVCCNYEVKINLTEKILFGRRK